HDQGDEALRIIARAITGTLRSGDLVGRIGGEEIGVFLFGVETPEAESAAERIRRTINDADFTPANRRQRLSVSVGGAVIQQPPLFSDLFRIADQQLYVAKNSGRNRVAVSAVVATGPIPMAAA